MKKSSYLSVEILVPNTITYTHRTSESNAISIMNNGFLGTRHLEYTTDSISDTISFAYFTAHRKGYGKAIVIIQVSKKICDGYWDDKYHGTPWYEKMTDQKRLKELENELIEKDECSGEGQFDFLIPNRFIKGYIIDDKFIENPNFNPF